MKGNEIPEGKYEDVVRTKCEACGKNIIVRDTALHLCDNCFNEKCGNCGHIRAEHIAVGKCTHTFSLNHKTKRGQMCECKRFVTTYLYNIVTTSNL